LLGEGKGDFDCYRSGSKKFIKRTLINKNCVSFTTVMVHARHQPNVGQDYIYSLK